MVDVSQTLGLRLKCLFTVQPLIVPVVLTGLISGKEGFFQLHDCSRSSEQCKMQIRIKVS